MPAIVLLKLTAAEIRRVVGEAGLPAFDQIGAERRQQLLGGIHGLDVDQISGDRGHARLRLLRHPGDRDESLVPARLAEPAALPQPRPVESVAQQPVDGMAGLVARPLFVDVLVQPRERAHHFALAGVEADVGADCVHDVDRRHLPELPGPRLEAVGLGDERADRTEIDHIATELAPQRFLEIGSDLHILAAADGADILDPGDLLHEADAARAVDAAGHERLHDRTHIFFADRALVIVVAVVAPAIGHRLVLQIAFAALVADRAIERMVYQQELHHPFARLADARRVGEDLLIVGGGQGAARLRLGRPRLHLDQAHPAIAGDGEPLVIAEARNLLARQLAGLEHRRALRHFDLDTVDFDLGHR